MYMCINYKKIANNFALTSKSISHVCFSFQPQGSPQKVNLHEINSAIILHCMNLQTQSGLDERMKTKVSLHEVLSVPYIFWRHEQSCAVKEATSLPKTYFVREETKQSQRLMIPFLPPFQHDLCKHFHFYSWTNFIIYCLTFTKG